jgi:ATP-dependent RNA helicase RhlE
LKDRGMDRVLIFSRTKHGADKISKHLTDAGIDAQAIHGNKSQGARERALASFKAGKTRALVATDIAARGIDIDSVSHVVNFDLPNVPESYVHRIGRTARAGAAGIAISFCAPDERGLLRDIERLIQQQVPALEGFDGPRDAIRGAGPTPHRRGGAPNHQQRSRGRNGGGGGGYNGQQRNNTQRTDAPRNGEQRPNGELNRMNFMKPNGRRPEPART